MAKEKPFGSADRDQLESWFEKQVKAGRSFRDIRKDARKEFAGFDWRTIISALLDLFLKYFLKP